MSEQQNQDFRVLAAMLQDLPKEDLIHAQFLIDGLKLARKIDKLNKGEPTNA